METPQSSYVLYNNPILIEQSFGDNLNDFRSPIIPHMQHLPPTGAQQTIEFCGVFTSFFRLDAQQQRIDKTHWICDYSDDIFQTLRETELNRRLVCFRSQQVGQRAMLLKLLKTATEKHKLSRTTLHLAIYLLDCFMDNYTIRADKLNLSAITCLIIAAKIEEADVDMPKFADLNKLLNEVYTLNEFKNVECKVLSTFNFDLIRPTAATFAEYFANSIVTLQDYHIFINHWNNEIILNNYHQQQQDLQTQVSYGNEMIINTASTCMVLSTPCPYNSYEDMLSTLSKTFFELIDISLSYLKFANARPSIIASACIAAVRQMHGIFPIWTPYLVKLTHCTADIISPFVEAILAIYRIHYNNERLQSLQATPNTPISTQGHNTTILCDSPDSGIVSGNDTKSMRSDTDNDEDDCVVSLNMETNLQDISSPLPDESDEEEDEAYHCLEYPTLAKRRRIF
ncbi:cyclin-J [Lucilia sericata]|uniref:cyclin-J n=1 Tax=Lucilia sericata TaxID=13632 RepID=UPI0018A812E2|nr:cyclin-J [Lucilia sericata]